MWNGLHWTLPFGAFGGGSGPRHFALSENLFLFLDNVVEEEQSLSFGGRFRALAKGVDRF